jgi:hypothetical protein
MKPLLFALCLALAGPAFAQVTPPQTITFEGVGTPIPYEPEMKVPKSARLKKLALTGGGKVSFRTRDGADYVALVTHLGTTAIVGVGSKGKINPFRYMDVRIRKSKSARFDSFVPIPAGQRIDDKGTTDTSDDEVVAWDQAGAAAFNLYDTDTFLYPIDGSSLQVVRLTPPDPLNLVKDSYDLTTTSLDFARIQIVGDMVYDDFVVTYGH